MPQPAGIAALNLTTYDDYQFHEADLNNIAQAGRQRVGKSFDINQDQEFTFDFPNIDTSVAVNLNIALASAAFTPTSFIFTASNLDVGSVLFAALNTNSDIFLLGSWFRFENNKTGKGYDYITKTRYEDILKEMHYKCSFIHPTVMFRKEVLETIGNYPTNYPHAEDYAFFWSIMKKYKAAILPEKLVTIELTWNTVSSKNYKEQLQIRKKVVINFGTMTHTKIAGLLFLQIRQLLPPSIIRIIKNIIKN